MYNMRMIFKKSGAARFISHLELMHTFQRSFSRAGIPIWQTEGFNRHTYVSIAVPLSVGFGGNAEILDFNLNSDTIQPDIAEKLNNALPYGISVLQVYQKVRPVKEISYGEYYIHFWAEDCQVGLCSKLKNAITGDLELLKKSKSGESMIKLADYMPSCDDKLEMSEDTDGSVNMKIILGAGQVSLSPNNIIDYIKSNINKSIKYEVLRNRILDSNCQSFM